MTTQHLVKHKVIGFAEKDHCQLKIPADKRNACSNDKSGTGYFVGIISRNTAYLVATEDGIVACFTVRRVPDTEAYDKDCKEVIFVKYTDYVRGGPRTLPIAVHVPGAIARHPDPSRIPNTYVPRAAYLRPKDFDKFGFTDGCRGCEFLATGIGKRQNKSAECRLRVEALLAGEDEGKRRLQEAVERKDQWLLAKLNRMPS